MRLIDVDAAIKILENGKYSPDYCKEHGIDHSISMGMVRILLNALPLAKPDVIHCKDCVYCGSDVVDAPYGLTKKIWWCDRLYEEANENLMVEPDDFCSFAKRRDE